LAESMNMASLYPAHLASQTKKGKIEAGFDADLIIFNKDYQVQGSFFKGQHLAKTT
jgi:N-acetylglucosamine-6-phosphate deacetylase